MDLPYYHGPLTKKDCEVLLLKEGVDGNFLLRDSESVPGALCLCVSFKSVVYTYRIFKEKEGYYRIQASEGTRKPIFRSLRELVSNYQKPNQGLVVHLLNPIMKQRTRFSWRKLKLQMDDIYQNSDNDYVEVLP